MIYLPGESRTSPSQVASWRSAYLTAHTATAVKAQNDVIKVMNSAKTIQTETSSITYRIETALLSLLLKASKIRYQSLLARKTLPRINQFSIKTTSTIASK